MSQRAFCGVVYSDGYEENSGAGKEVSMINSATCHARDMRTDATGPALVNTLQKWNNDTLALLSYVRNPQQYLEKHPESRIAEVHEEFGLTVMDSFSELTREELEALLVYIER